MPGPNIVNQCVLDLKSKILSSEAVNIDGKTLYIYDQDDIMNLKKELVPPFVGIVYVGMREVDTKASGQGTELVIDLFVMGADCVDKSEDMAGQTTLLLDHIRNAIKCTRSPSGHYWIFRLEAPVERGDDLLYMQRWSCRAMLTS